MSSSDGPDGPRGKVGEPGNRNGVAVAPSKNPGAWKKGQSGNPSGRPALAKAWAAATGGKTMADVTADALKIVYDRMVEGPRADHNGNANDADWRFATQKVLEYAPGKPKEHVVMEGADENATPSLDLSDIESIPLEERKQILGAIRRIRELRAAKAASDGDAEATGDPVTEH